MERTELRRWITETLGPNGDGGEGPLREVALAAEALLKELEEEREKRIEAEETLDFYKASADAMPNPIFIKDEDLRFVFFNRAYREFFGLEKGENLGRQVRDLDYLSQEDRDRYHAEDSELLRSLSVIQYDTVYRTADKKTVEALYWSKGFPVPETGSRGLVGEIVDISREKKTQRDLAQSMRALEVLMRDAKNASNTDPLTKLYNRNIMEEELPAVIRNAETMGQPVCLILMDVDHFKEVNDQYGHPFGDEILRRFAQVMNKIFRQKDLGMRYGGDEFLLLLPGAELEQAKACAERFRTTVQREVILPDGQPVTPSMGIAQWKPGEDMPAFISRADEALYMAKRAGRNRFAVKE